MVKRRRLDLDSTNESDPGQFDEAESEGDSQDFASSESEHSEHEYASDSDATTEDSANDEEVISIGGTSTSSQASHISDETADYESFGEDAHQEYFGDDNEDPDARYARLLQQQEIALAHNASTLLMTGGNLMGHLLPMMMGVMGGEGEEHSEGEDSLDMSYESLLQLEENLGEVKKRGISEAAWQSLQRMSFSPTSSDSSPEQDKSEVVCPICMCEYEVGEALLRLPCGHCIHEGCGSTWLRQRASCPICRQVIADPPTVIDLSATD